MLLFFLRLLLQPPKMFALFEPTTGVLTNEPHFPFVRQFAELVIGQPELCEQWFVRPDLNFKSGNVRSSDVHHAVFVTTPLDFRCSAHLAKYHIDVLHILVTSALEDAVRHTSPSVRRIDFDLDAKFTYRDIREHLSVGFRVNLDAL